MSKPKSIHFMLDLETLDTAPTAHVLSAALVIFDPITGEILAPEQTIENSLLFKYVRRIFDTKKSIVFGLEHQAGATVSAKTLNWWNQQNKQYFYSLISTEESEDTFHAFLIDFSNTMYDLVNFEECDVHVWCTGTFDLDILRNATARYGLKWNVPYWAYKDVRVAKQMAETFNLLDEIPEVTHDAYDDCLRQIKYVSAVYGKLNNARSV